MRSVLVALDNKCFLTHVINPILLKLTSVSRNSKVQSSNLITAEDRDFLVHHWNKTISSTPDVATKKMVDKKLQRQQQYDRYLNQTPPRAPKPSAVPRTTTDTSPLCNSPPSSGDEYYRTKVKRVRQSEKIDVSPSIIK